MRKPNDMSHYGRYGLLAMLSTGKRRAAPDLWQGERHVRHRGPLRKCPQPGAACANSYTSAPRCPACHTPTVPLGKASSS